MSCKLNGTIKEDEAHNMDVDFDIKNDEKFNGLANKKKK
jgi:hypothetical protein